MSPRVVGEERRRVEDARPPSDIVPHPWLLKEHRPAFKQRSKEGKPLEMYISRQAEEKMRKHALESRDAVLEVMGFMLGEVRRHKGSFYAVAKDVATTKLDASAVHVRFDRSGMDELATALESQPKEHIIVGWYHSHPGHGCFLSPTDIETQSTMFAEPYHVALVVDPVKEEMAAFKIAGKGAVPATWAMYL